MNNIVTAEVLIEGTRPLFWHHFGPDAIPLEKGEQTGVPGNDPEEWRKTVLMTKERQLYVESTYIFGTIRDGAKHTKKGKSSLQPLVCATLQVMDDKVLTDRYLPLEPLPTDSEECVYLDIRSCRNPSTRARNVRYRVATCPGWKMRFTISWDKTIISRAEMESVLNDAGTLSGIGDGRSIGFGRFVVRSFTVHGG